MSDDTTTTSTEATPPMEPVPPVTVTLEIPGRLHRSYTLLTEAGLYVSVEEAIRQAVLTAWRFERGSYHSLRLDLDGKDDDEKADEEPAPSAEA